MPQRISASIQTDKYLSLRTLACQKYPFHRAFLGVAITEAIDHWLEHETNTIFKQLNEISKVAYPNLSRKEREKKIREDCVKEYIKKHGICFIHEKN
jgi:uncharacterized protein YgfB (UPF0149 family)